MLLPAMPSMERGYNHLNAPIDWKLGRTSILFIALPTLPNAYGAPGYVLFSYLFAGKECVPPDGDLEAVD